MCCTGTENDITKCRNLFQQRKSEANIAKNFSDDNRLPSYLILIFRKGDLLLIYPPPSPPPTSNSQSNKMGGGKGAKGEAYVTPNWAYN